MPVSYTIFEFQRFKKRVDNSALDEVRSRLLAEFFNKSEEEVSEYIKEAEELIRFYGEKFRVREKGIGLS